MSKSNYKLFDISKLGLNVYKMRSDKLINYYNIVESYFPKELLSEDDYISCKDFFSKIPIIKTNMIGLEKRLNTKDTNIDISISVDPSVEPEERLDLLKLEKVNSSNSVLNSNNIYWSRIKKFAEQWSDLNSPLSHFIREIWLEFDSDSFNNKQPVPSVFIDTKMIYGKNQEKLDCLINIFNISLKNFFRENILSVKKIEKNIQNCIEKLPTTSKVTLFGIMINRKPFSIRLLIDIETDEIMDYLKKLKISICKEKVTNVINDLNMFSKKIILALSIGEEIDNMFALECFLRDGYGQVKSSYSNMLKYLKRNNLCKDHEYKEISKFQGSIVRKLEDKNISENNLLETDEYIAFDWGINHVKFVWRNYDVYTKIYYYISHLQFSTKNKNLLI